MMMLVMTLVLDDDMMKFHDVCSIDDLDNDNPNLECDESLALAFEKSNKLMILTMIMTMSMTMTMTMTMIMILTMIITMIMIMMMILIMIIRTLNARQLLGVPTQDRI